MSRFSRVRRPAQIVFVVVVAGFIAYTLVTHWADFSASVAAMNGGWLVVAVAAGFAGVAFSMLSTRSAIAAFGRRMRVRDAARLVFISQIGKYLPGGVWPIVVGTQLGVAGGVPASVTAISLSAQLVVSVVTGGTLGLGVLLSFPALAAQFAWLVILGIVVGVVVLLPPVLTRLIRGALRLMRRGVTVERIGSGALAASVGWSLVSWAFFGVHLWCILAALHPQSIGSLPVAISAYALAWVAGFLVVIAPAGAGVRELVLGLALAGAVAASSILGVVLVSRFALILVDVVLCLGALAASRGAIRATRARAATETDAPRDGAVS